MSEIKLEVCRADDKSVVEKVYTAEGYDLMMGTLEDFVSIIDIDKLDDNKEVMKMIIKGYKQLKPLIQDVFPEMTSEDWRNVKLTSLVETVVDIAFAVMDTMEILKSGKRTRA